MIIVSLELLEASIVNWQVIGNAHIIGIIYDTFLFNNDLLNSWILIRALQITSRGIIPLYIWVIKLMDWCSNSEINWKKHANDVYVHSSIKQDSIFWSNCVCYSLQKFFLACSERLIVKYLWPNHDFWNVDRHWLIVSQCHWTPIDWMWKTFIFGTVWINRMGLLSLKRYQ